MHQKVLSSGTLPVVEQHQGVLDSLSGEEACREIASAEPIAHCKQGFWPHTLRVRMDQSRRTSDLVHQWPPKSLMDSFMRLLPLVIDIKGKP